MDVDSLSEQINLVKLELAIVKTRLEIISKQVDGFASNVKWWVAGMIFPVVAGLVSYIVMKGIK